MASGSSISSTVANKVCSKLDSLSWFRGLRHLFYRLCRADSGLPNHPFPSAVGLRLQLEELGVEAAARDQLGMAAHLDNPPLIEHDDQVGHARRREAVRDEYGHRAGGLPKLARGGGPAL